MFYHNLSYSNETIADELRANEAEPIAAEQIPPKGLRVNRYTGVRLRTRGIENKASGPGVMA